MSTGVSRMRADARQNRDRIVEVARELFAGRGLDVPMAAIARRAGVGMATLYRRFPTKESLVTEVFADQFAECVSIVDDALADPDPWRGLCTGIERICAMHAADRGFTAAFISMFPDSFDMDGERTRAYAALAELIGRAKRSGRLRADFALEDFTLVLMANSGIVAGSPEASLAASRRLVAYLLSAFRADNAQPLPPPAPLDLSDIIPKPK